jgi:hypothetical protein
MSVYTGEIAVKGKPIRVRTLVVDQQEIVFTGAFLKTARLKEEWDGDVDCPEALIDEIKRSGLRADLVTFAQRLPESKPKFAYPMEWDNVAALPISTYEHWLENQLHPNHRNKVKKAEKEGLVIKRVAFNDELVSSIMRILNEVPVRQGGPFLDYGKDFDTVKREHATYLDRSDFLGAYCGDELVGYIKLVFAGRFMRTMQILSMIKHRAKAPTNALMAEAIRICAERRIPFLVYGKYSYGKVGSSTLREFKFYNGFEHVLLPRYHVPLTPLGRMAMMSGLHKGVLGVLPSRLVRLLLHARRAWYSKKERPATASRS